MRLECEEIYTTMKPYQQPPLRVNESWRKYSKNNCNNHFHSNEVYNHRASNIEQIKRDLGALIYPSEAGPGAAETRPDIHRPLHELSLTAGCRVPDTERRGLLPVGLQAQPPKVTGDGTMVGVGWNARLCAGEGAHSHS